jgi:hypothetical protein
LSFFRKFRKSFNNDKPKTDSDSIFSLSSAYITLETKLGLKNTGRCTVSLKSVSGMHFSEMKDDIKRFLDASKAEFELSYNIVTDSYGYLWVVLQGRSMEDILAQLIAVGDTIQDKGFSNHLLAAVFEFSDEGKNNSNKKHRQYLIYNYKYNKFYPFVPIDKEIRNTEEEMRMMAEIADEIPFERDMTLWYPLWDLPL